MIMNLFPFTEFHLLSSLPEAEIVKRLSPDKNKLGSWRFKKKNEFYVVYDLRLFLEDVGPHMWIQLNQEKTSGVGLKICQKHSPIKLTIHLFALSFFFVGFGMDFLEIFSHNFIFEKDFPRILNFSKYFLFILIGIYTMLLLPFLIETNKNKKFIMSLLEAEPYTPPKQSTDKQKSDIIQ
jgi:hypothetical protein